ncbi:MAG: virulence RhuM family protein [Pirellula sp.]|nr:virulence RhuM family protein [Pirellula sp.]
MNRSRPPFRSRPFRHVECGERASAADQQPYFDELLERIRDIRSSERRFYQKVLDIYATSVHYTPKTEMSQEFFATVYAALD